jgi:hypothetical protein
VCVFRQKFAFDDDAIEFHAFVRLEALPCVWSMAFLSGVQHLLPVGTAMRVVNAIPLGCSLLLPVGTAMRVVNVIPLGCSILLPVGTVHSVQTLKAEENKDKGEKPGEQEEDGTVRVFRQTFSLEDAIGSHACSLQALTCM